MSLRRLLLGDVVKGPGTFDRLSDGSFVPTVVIDDTTGVIYASGATINPPAGGGGAAPPPSRVLYVDNNRSDSYTQNGALTTPFKTIMQAVNQIAANGDNASFPYTINIAPGIYLETIDMSNPALTYLTFVGYGVQVGNSGSFNSVCVQVINNDNMTDFKFVGMTFQTTAISPTHGMQFSTTTNGSNFLNGTQTSYGGMFVDCILGFNSQDLFMSVAGGIALVNCALTAQINISNVIVLYLFGCSLNQLASGTNLSIVTVGGAAPAGFSASQAQMRYCNSLYNVAMDAASSFIAAEATQQRGTVTVNGHFTSRQSECRGAITVNSGGIYTEDAGASHGSTLTINSGGSYLQTGQLGIKTIALNGAILQTGSGSPNGAVTGNPGDIYINTAGGSTTTFWVKESGSATNTGWVGK